MITLKINISCYSIYVKYPTTTLTMIKKSKPLINIYRRVFFSWSCRLVNCASNNLLQLNFLQTSPFFISFFHLILCCETLLLYQRYILCRYKSVGNDFSAYCNLIQSDNNMIICKNFFKTILNFFSYEKTDLISA